jgi:hypothetical protein
MSQNDDRVYFTIPFDDKDDAKALGARFDGTRRLWYAPDTAVKEALDVRWAPAPGQAGGKVGSGSQQLGEVAANTARFRSSSPNNGDERILYDVPFADNAKAKSLGARFDGSSKKWHALSDIARAAFLSPRAGRPAPLLANTFEFALHVCGPSRS